MNPFVITLIRQTLPLWALGVAVTLGGGCRHRWHHHGMFAPHRYPLSSTPGIGAVNSGYCETRWAPLVPTPGPAGYIEQYAEHSAAEMPIAELFNEPNEELIEELINEPSEVYIDRRPAASVNDAAALEDVEIIVDSVDPQ